MCVLFFSQTFPFEFLTQMQYHNIEISTYFVPVIPFISLFFHLFGIPMAKLSPISKEKLHSSDFNKCALLSIFDRKVTENFVTKLLQNTEKQCNMGWGKGGGRVGVGGGGGVHSTSWKYLNLWKFIYYSCLQNDSEFFD